MPKALSNGNLALVNGAMAWAAEASANVRRPDGKILFAAGYPITPVNEVTEYFSRISDEANVAFVQAESEVAAGNMLLGAASVGVPAITVTSSPGISLMQEAISYAAGMELGGRGLVYVDVARGGPGLGNIQGAQSDFNQAVLGGGHGDHQKIVLAPATAQEMFDFTRLAFELSSRYRIPGFILSDGYVGQLKESYTVPDRVREFEIEAGRDVRTSIFVREGVLEEHNWKLARRFDALKLDPALQKIALEPYRLEDPDGPARIVLVNYGFFSRIGYGIVNRARDLGLAVGQVSLKALNPFPEKELLSLLGRYGPFYVIEGGIGQLADRLRTAVGAPALVGACYRPGGTLPEETEVVSDLVQLMEEIDGAAFKKRFGAHLELLRGKGPYRENRGRRYDQIALTESTHEAEYRASMDGKRPEPRKSASMTDKNMYYCAGCDHKYTTEALGGAFDRLESRDVTLFSPVGCSIFLYDFFRKERVRNVQVPHGRGPAAASAVKRAKPDSIVLCYQGDGDALDIGLGELLHASARGEKITVIVINNGTYGMTGGQLSATTPVSQFSKTTPKGRDSGRNGFPIDLSQLLHRDGVSYYRRTIIGTPELNQQFSHFLTQAILHQMAGDGMSVLEVIATCTEHQRAPQDVIEAFLQEGKKLHQIALAKEYAAKTMPKTFALAVGWGEDFEDADARLKALEAPPSASNAGLVNARYHQLKSLWEKIGLVTPEELSSPKSRKAFKEMRFYLGGEGGQGVQSLADILMRADGSHHAFNSPWYEPEVTKARTVAAVTLAETPYVNPSPQEGEVDVLICLTPQMYYEKKKFVRTGGLVLVDTQGAALHDEQFAFTRIEVPAANLATAELKERRAANMVLLGVLNQVTELFDDERLERVIRQSLPKAAELNLKAYRLGKTYLTSGLKPGR